MGKGRNKDFLVSEMDNYQEMVEELDKHQDNLNKANEKSIKLDNNSNEVKDIVKNEENGIRFDSANGLDSMAYNKEFLEKNIKEMGISLKMKEFADIGIAYFINTRERELER